MNRPPPGRKSPAQQTFSTVTYAYLGVGALAFFGWFFEFPYVYPFISWLTDLFSPWISPWIYKFLHLNSPDLEVAVTLGALVFVALMISIPFLPILERWQLRERFQTGERQGIRVQKIRSKAKSDPKADNTAR
jgi:hypothetical protein